MRTKNNIPCIKQTQSMCWAIQTVHNTSAVPPVVHDLFHRVSFFNEFIFYMSSFVVIF